MIWLFEFHKTQLIAHAIGLLAVVGVPGKALTGARVTVLHSAPKFLGR